MQSPRDIIVNNKNEIEFNIVSRERCKRTSIGTATANSLRKTATHS